MFWADKLSEEITARFGKEKPVLIRDEKTPSGRVHVGSMRGVAIHGVIHEALTRQGIKNTFKYEFNDMDPMDGFPEYLPEEFRQHMGKPLRNVPSPEPGFENFADYFAQEFKHVIESAGFSPEFYNTSELYFSGRMDEAIKTALDNAADIRRIYREVSGSQKPDDWYPLSVMCEQCGKVGTTQVYAWDGERVSYRCEPHMVKWAQGCGHEGTVSPFGGKAKFPFKVEWPAKWSVEGVMVEGAGKDHSTKGGARDVASHIAKEVFKYDPPFDAPYEFFLVGGRKMSSSKGRGSSAKEISELIPAKIFRLALIGKDIHQQVNFDPEGDTIPTLYDQYDKLAEGYLSVKDDDYARLFTYIHPKGDIPAYKGELPRFREVAFVVQMPHLDLEREFPNADKEELHERADYARRWLERYAPEKFVFELQRELPEAAQQLTETQKKALAALAGYIEEADGMPHGEDMHHKLHSLKDEVPIAPAELFGAVYLAFLGKTSGPKAGWFLSVLDKGFVVGRLKEAAA